MATEYTPGGFTSYVPWIRNRATEVLLPAGAQKYGLTVELEVLGAIRIGAARGEVELHLGAPIKSASLDGGLRADIYQYDIGNEPSAGRAIGHGMMDVLTLGLWKVVGTPIEGVQGETYHATITYDQSDKVTDIKTKKVASTL